LEGFTIEDGPFWTIHPVYSENIIIRRLNILTYSGNTDGIVIDSSKNVFINDIELSTGDDVIAIKSGLDEEGRNINKPSENIVILNIKAKKGGGGISIGSEMSGGVRNIFVSDSQFDGTYYGVRIKSLESRGGIVENVWFENLRMTDIKKHAIILTMLYKTMMRSKKVNLPVFKNMCFNNIYVSDANDAIEILSLEDSLIDNIIFENIKINSERGVKALNASNLTFSGMEIKTEKYPVYEFNNSQKVNLTNIKCDSAIAISDCLKIKDKKASEINFEGENIY